MPAHPLEALFAPRSVAVVGASDVPGSVGEVLFRHLCEAPFRGRLYAVNARHASVRGVAAVASLDRLPEPVDLAILATRADTLPALVEACGRTGILAAAVISAGVTSGHPHDPGGQGDLADAARRAGVRLLGPNSLGVVRASLGLHAAFSAARAAPGTLALLTQSGGLASAILDWASGEGLGFSSVISIGNQLDVGFAEALDYLTLDPETESIVMYVEGIRAARPFMSALRAAARIKPVIVLKAGRDETGSRAAATHTGAMTGSDAVFEAALRRAGAVRVGTFIQLFSAAKCLASRYRPVGNQIAVVTNGGGPGVMAADRAQSCGLHLATLAPDTLASLDAALPAAWSHGNPVDLLEDADIARYAAALQACLADPAVDGVVAILTPQAMTDALGTARAVVDASRRHSKQIIACWMGDASVSTGRDVLQAAQIPVFRSPEPAVEAFANIAAFYQNQRLLVQVPGPLSHHEPPDLDAARAVIEAALAADRTTLSETESKAVLAAFRIPVAATVVARSVEDAILVAAQVGYPVALKVNAADVPHKADAGGVRLGVTGAAQLREAFDAILAAVRAAHPAARLDGVAVEPMVVKPAGRELMIGVLKDPVFGPVITFGAGGGDVELLADRAVALPPLNGFLARNLVERARAARTLGPWRNRPAADVGALEAVLLRVSEMVCELPWLREMDINPLILDHQGAIAADARMVIEPLAARGTDTYAHMAIGPYPSRLGSRWTTHDGREVVLRAIRPEDAAMEQDFVRGLSDEARYFRFINAMHELSERMVVRFTQIDYDREMALVAVVRNPADGSESQIGVARYVSEPDGRSCEFALVVTDGWQGQGVGTRLMAALMEAARARGLETMEGFVLGSNHKMLKLMETLGFEIVTERDDPSMKHVTRRLA